MRDVKLATDRLILRDFRDEDFDPLFATTRGSEYGRFYSEEELSLVFWRSLFDRFIAWRDAAVRTKYQLAICLRSGKLIGTCGIRTDGAGQGRASFGCALGREYWGRGYAREASERILSFGFNVLELDRIYADVRRGNRRVAVLLGRLGFVSEAANRRGGESGEGADDTVVYFIASPGH